MAELSKRIDKMLESVRPLADLRRKAQRTSRLKGATLTSILDAVERATAAEDRPILAEIDRQAGAYHEVRPDDLHGFGQWVLLLQDGTATLPDRLPRPVLLAWRDRYDPQWGGPGKPWCPMPFWKCRDCGMVLPHGVPGGWSESCPVCGGARIWHADLSKPLGANWIDPNPLRRGAAAD